MTTALFIIGAMTSLGCGWNVMTVNNSTGTHELAWILGGFGGAVMMVIAIAWSQP